jgi:hypothetical protein
VAAGGVGPTVQTCPHARHWNVSILLIVLVNSSQRGAGLAQFGHGGRETGAVGGDIKGRDSLFLPYLKSRTQALLFHTFNGNIRFKARSPAHCS